MMLNRGWTGLQGQLQTIVVPLEMLPQAIGRDVEADLAARRAGTFVALDPATLRYVDWLDAHQAERRHDRIRSGLMSLLDSADQGKARSVVEEYPELLEDEADALITQMIEVSQDESQPQATDILRRRRLLLRRVSKCGFDALEPER